MKPFAAILSTLAVYLSASCTISAQETTYHNAPKVVPNTTEAMQTPEFWIDNVAGDPDAVVLTPGQIERLNEKNRRLPREITDINGDPYSIMDVVRSKEGIGLQYNVERPLAITSFPGDSLRARFDTHRQYFESRTFYDRRQMVWDEERRAELYAKMDARSIPDVVRPGYGILVRHGLNRALPTNKEAYWSRDGWLDGLQSTALDMASPVAVLHASSDGDWLYVRSETAFGWIPARDVALGPRHEIDAYINDEDFVVAADHRIPVYSDGDFTVHLADIMLGERVSLAEKTARGYHVRVPFRNPDGGFAVADGWIRPDAQVSVGYQPFTQRNIIETVFRMLYRPYYWADSENEFDCCGLQRAVLRTFGIKTGRWTSYILHAPDPANITAFPRRTPDEVKYEHLVDCEPGICFVGSAGHINMYLGEVDGRHYVIHQGGYSYHTDENTVMEFKRVNVNDTELEGGSNISNWTEISVFKP